MNQNVQPQGRAQIVLTSLTDGVFTITLNRPESLNALSPQLLNEFRKVLLYARDNEDVRAVVVTGAGRAFCAGGDVDKDIKAIGRMNHKGWRNYHRHTNAPVRLITEMEKPVIAAVNGMAGGAGFDLALTCDIRIASEDARFGMFYIRMGVLPAWGGTYTLPRIAGAGWAKLLSFTGDVIDAREAERIGLVEKVVPRGEFAAVVSDLAQRLAHSPTMALGRMKAAINKSYQMNFEQTLEYITEALYPLLSTEDYKEAYTAFLEKRKPAFKGK